MWSLQGIPQRLKFELPECLNQIWFCMLNAKATCHFVINEAWTVRRSTAGLSTRWGTGCCTSSSCSLQAWVMKSSTSLFCPAFTGTWTHFCVDDSSTSGLWVAESSFLHKVDILYAVDCTVGTRTRLKCWGITFWCKQRARQSGQKYCSKASTFLFSIHYCHGLIFEHKTAECREATVSSSGLQTTRFLTFTTVLNINVFQIDHRQNGGYCWIRNDTTTINEKDIDCVIHRWKNRCFFFLS